MEFKTDVVRLRLAAHCEQRERLIDAFGSTIHEALELNELQLQAVMEGDCDLGRFDLLIHESMERKLDAKSAYLAHLAEHGCASQA